MLRSMTCGLLDIVDYIETDTHSCANIRPLADLSNVDMVMMAIRSCIGVAASVRDLDRILSTRAWSLETEITRLGAHATIHASH